MVGWDEIDDRHEGGAACRGGVVFQAKVYFGGQNPSKPIDGRCDFYFHKKCAINSFILFVVSFKFIEVTLFNILYYFRFFDISHY